MKYFLTYELEQEYTHSCLDQGVEMYHAFYNDIVYYNQKEIREMTIEHDVNNGTTEVDVLEFEDGE